MGILNTSEGWGLLARLLHWAMAVLIIFMLGLGFYMVEILSGDDSDTLLQRFALTQTHKSWGVVVFALALVRIFWRLLNPTPALPDRMGSLERGLARAGHLGLYICMILMPLSGWLMASASPFQDSYGIKNMVFQQFELPDPFQPGSQELNDLFANIHFVAAIVLVIILVTHVGAALKHHLIDRDSVLRRMVIGR